MNLFSKSLLVLSLAAGQFGSILSREQTSLVVHANVIQSETNFEQLAIQNLRSKREDELENVKVTSKEVDSAMGAFKHVRSVGQARIAARGIVEALLKTEKKKQKLEMDKQKLEMDKQELQLKNRDLQSNLTLLSGNQKYLIEVVSLSVLRNKIYEQEARYGIGHLEVDQLAKQLQQDSLSTKNMVAEMRRYANQKYKEAGIENNTALQKIITEAKLVIENDLKTLSEIPEDPKMSDSVSVKAGKHMLRCKLIFYLYSTYTEVKEMKKVVDLKFGGSVDDACRETGFLVVILSTLGIHVLPPSFALREISSNEMKQGLYQFGIRKEKTMAVVDLLHCGEIDQNYFTSPSTVL